MEFHVKTNAGLAALALAGLATTAAAAEMSVTITIPRLDVAEYHRPYLAAWIERADQIGESLIMRRWINEAEVPPEPSARG
jgi:hypothetical protein